MSNLAIEIKNISKVYKLYDNNTERLLEAINPFGKKYHKEFYALSDINLVINQGETVGIIGKNGSGKSTLLKIITGVLTPSAGTVSVNGSISSLLELGAGFNPEYTGLENIYLNATIMGFSKQQIDEKLGEILNFADIGDFIHQPVKTYSSGMFVRLAFSLAISVDPDILIIDEALSVGDTRFQQKCYRKIREVKEKKTVLFVSHDLAAITNFCDRIIWLNDGKKFKEGIPDQIVEEYHAFMNYDCDVEDNDNSIDSTETELTEIDSIPSGVQSFGQLGAQIVGASILNNRGNKGRFVSAGENVELVMKIKTSLNISLPLIGFTLKDRLGNSILIVNTEFINTKVKPLDQNRVDIFKWKFEFPKIRDGVYTLDLAIAEGTYQSHVQHHWLIDAVIVEVKNLILHPLDQGLCIVDKIEFENCGR